MKNEKRSGGGAMGTNGTKKWAEEGGWGGRMDCFGLRPGNGKNRMSGAKYGDVEPFWGGCI